MTRTHGLGIGWNQLTFDHLSGIVLPGSDIHAALIRSLAYAGLTAFIACGFGLLLALRLEATRGALRPIVLPLVAVSIGTAFAMTFIRTVFELPVSQLLIPKAGAPAPPIILKLFSHEMDGAASALSLASMIVAGGIAGLVWLLARRFAADRGQRRFRPAPMVETTS